MSWAISYKYKFIFVHIPKTGGTSICGSKTTFLNSALARHLNDNDIRPGGHRSVRRLKEVFPVEYSKYFKFAFVREPFERIASLYWSILRSPDVDSLDFDQFVETLPLLHSFMAFARPQSWWIEHENGSLGVDWLGDFAYITEEFSELCPKIGLPSIKVPRLNSSGKTQYRELYTKETEKIVRDVYANDFILYEKYRKDR